VMAEKPQLVVVNKIDVTEVREQEDELRVRLLEAIGDRGSDVKFISAATGEGVNSLMGNIMGALSAMAKEDLDDSPEPEPMRSRPQRSAPRETVRRENGVFVVQSEQMERLTAMADTRDQRVLLQLWREMRKSGLATRLLDAGMEPGDTLRFGKVEIVWF